MLPLSTRRGKFRPARCYAQPGKHHGVERKKLCRIMTGAPAAEKGEWHGSEDAHHDASPCLCRQALCSCQQRGACSQERRSAWPHVATAAFLVTALMTENCMTSSCQTQRPSIGPDCSLLQPSARLAVKKTAAALQALLLSSWTRCQHPGHASQAPHAAHAPCAPCCPTGRSPMPTQLFSTATPPPPPDRQPHQTHA